MAQAVRELHQNNAASAPATVSTPPSAPQLISVPDEDPPTLQALELVDTSDETLADYERRTGISQPEPALHDVCPAWDLADEREFDEQQQRRKRASPMRRIDALFGRGGAR